MLELRRGPVLDSNWHVSIDRMQQLPGRRLLVGGGLCVHELSSWTVHHDCWLILVLELRRGPVLGDRWLVGIDRM